MSSLVIPREISVVNYGLYRVQMRVFKPGVSIILFLNKKHWQIFRKIIKNTSGRVPDSVGKFSFLFIPENEIVELTYNYKKEKYRAIHIPTLAFENYVSAIRAGEFDSVN